MTSGRGEDKEKAGMKMMDQIENDLSGPSTSLPSSLIWSMKTLWAVIFEAIPSTA